MPIYEFKCPSCGWRLDVECSIDQYSTSAYVDRSSAERQCESCGTPTARILSFSAKPIMPDHFNRSAGEYVTSERSLKDSFKRQSEAATIRTGIEHNFVPIDPGDKKALGVTDDGLEATARRKRELGEPLPDVLKHL